MSERAPRTAAVDVVAETRAPRGLRGRLSRALARVLRERGLRSRATVVLVDDRRIRLLKLEHWGEDASTDVLSFPAWEPGDLVRPAHLGDVFVSLETAARQAPEHAHSVEQEVATLCGHGLAHLLGHDHQTEQDWAVFHELEAAAREALRAEPAGSARPAGTHA